LSSRFPPASGDTGAPRILFAFVAGLIAVLIGREPALWIAAQLARQVFGSAFTLLPSAVAYATDPVWPFAVPRLLETTLAGGIWGIVLARLTRSEVPHPLRLLKAFAFGLVVPTLASWGLDLLLQGRKFDPLVEWRALAPEVIANAVWGLTAVGMFEALIGVRRAPPAPTVARRQKS
jgi:hypothetical protein